ncbi:MAG: Holliday junction resolvase RuvX [Planctomycetota bacterium]
MRGAVVAVDYGARRTGLAACDSLRIAAVPIGVVHTTDREELIERIVDAVDERNATTLVFGLPLHMGGHDSERSRTVRALAADVKNRLPNVDVVEVDERLTTKEATILLAQAGLKGKKRKDFVDAVAAMIILKTYLKDEGLLEH